MSITSARGVALLEIAIVLMVISLLLGGLTPTLTTRIEHARLFEARRAIAEIIEALVGYAQLHGRLPCPADPTLSESAPQAGIERPLRGEDCEGGYAGAVPWATLGVRQLDPWGRRFTMRVARELADARDECSDEIAPHASICVTSQSTAHQATLDGPEVRERVRAGRYPAGTDPIATRLAVVVLSHGPNGFGGYLPFGKPIAHPAGLANDDERANSDADRVSFITRTPSDTRGGCSDRTPGATPCTFDDVLAWLPRGTLIAALARSGRLR